jgi:hypothetical protein
VSLRIACGIRGCGALGALIGVVIAAVPAAAQDRSEVLHEAAEHFQRGVSLYGEADYRGALVEFKRAARLAPNTTVLYNIGQTQFQLRDYAAALTTFERYQSEAGPSGANHAEVQSAIEVLRSRVGRLTITTDPVGAEVSVDDSPVGSSPFDRSVLVSVGHVKVTATIAGRPAATRYIDVAAGDDVSVMLQLGAASAPNLVSTVFPPLDVTARSRGMVPRWHPTGWIVTGIAAASAVAFAILARREANDLAVARRTYPTTQSNLSHLANVTTTFAVITDALAATAMIAGGITLYSTVSGRASDGGPGKAEAHLSVGRGSIHLETTF